MREKKIDDDDDDEREIIRKKEKERERHTPTNNFPQPSLSHLLKDAKR